MKMSRFPLKNVLRAFGATTSLVLLASACEPNEQAVPDPAMPPKPRVEEAGKPPAGDGR